MPDRVTGRYAIGCRWIGCMFQSLTLEHQSICLILEIHYVPAEMEAHSGDVDCDMCVASKAGPLADSLNQFTCQTYSRGTRPAENGKR